MCGISGVYSKSHDLKSLLIQFNNALDNRGPDYRSFYLNENNNFGMSHTRLSIIDLSQNGNQPMEDYLGNWVISYNGEIYNHLEIRNYLTKKFKDKIKWKSSSDTETILMSNIILGFKKTLELLEGMFAFALYNKNENQLFIARDRMGEKPLYYYHKENIFIFGSDISVFKKVKNLNFQIDDKILPQYLQTGCIKAPNSIYKNIKKLEPGFYLKLFNNFSVLEKQNYWSLKNIVEKSENINQISEENFLIEKNKLKKLIESTVIKQTISDVQIGSFLSGGVDSSLISSIMSKYSKNKIKTFTVGFNNKNYDESKQAKNISKHVNSDHYEYFMSKKELIDTVNNLHLIYSEPFADSSQIPTYLISKLMKKEAKVILSGDGGDEIFGGYNRYIYLNKIKLYSKILPNYLKRNINILIKFLPLSFFDKYFSIFGIRNFQIKFKKLIDYINVKNDDELYKKMISLNHNPEFYLNNNIIIKNQSDKDSSLPVFESVEEKFMFLDQTDYLHNDILCKVDRATMFNSVESRAPLLDHKIVEHSWKIPISYKIHKKGKYIIREILKDYLPKNLISNEKTGFGIPIDYLLRNDLKDWTEEIIFSAKKNDNILNHKNFESLWLEHKSKKINNGEKLWPMLVLQNWLINQ